MRVVTSKKFLWVRKCFDRLVWCVVLVRTLAGLRCRDPPTCGSLASLVAGGMLLLRALKPGDSVPPTMQTGVPRAAAAPAAGAQRSPAPGLDEHGSFHNPPD